VVKTTSAAVLGLRKILEKPTIQHEKPYAWIFSLSKPRLNCQHSESSAKFSDPASWELHLERHESYLICPHRQLIARADWRRRFPEFHKVMDWVQG
jgi:hypothetical protein